MSEWKPFVANSVSAKTQWSISPMLPFCVQMQLRLTSAPDMSGEIFFRLPADSREVALGTARFPPIIMLA